MTGQLGQNTDFMPSVTSPLRNTNVNANSSRGLIPEYWEAITPSDTALTVHAFAFMHKETTDQDIKVKYANGTITTFNDVPAYTPIHGGPIEIVYSTGTEPTTVYIGI